LRNVCVVAPVHDRYGADGFGHCVPKDYIYSALVFSILDEFLTFRLRRGKKAQAIVLHKKYMKDNYHQ